MEQLTGLDTSFLNLETATTYGHVSGLAVFDPSTASVPPTLDDMKKLIMERIHLLDLILLFLSQFQHCLDLNPLRVPVPDQVKKFDL